MRLRFATGVLRPDFGEEGCAPSGKRRRDFLEELQCGVAPFELPNSLFRVRALIMMPPGGTIYHHLYVTVDSSQEYQWDTGTCSLEALLLQPVPKIVTLFAKSP